MQELWLFGQLKTLETGGPLGKADEDAKVVAALLAQLTGVEGGKVENVNGIVKAGSGVKVED